jgi:hypothetical protein
MLGDIQIRLLLNVCIHIASDVERWRIRGRRGTVCRGNHRRGHGRVRDHVSTRRATGKTGRSCRGEETGGTGGGKSTRVKTPATNGIHWRTTSAPTCRADMSTALTSGITADAAPLVAHVERDGVQGGNDLMHVLVHQMLLRSNVCHLLVMALARVGDG